MEEELQGFMPGGLGVVSEFNAVFRGLLQEVQ